MSHYKQHSKISSSRLIAASCALSLILLTACSGGDNSPAAAGINTSKLTAVDDNYDIDGTIGSSVLTVLDNDSFGDDATVSTISSPSNGGTASIAPDGQSIVYTAASGYSGLDSFSYSLTDSSGNVSIGQVTLSISNAVSLNIPPLAVADVYTVITDSSNNTLSVLANDTDANGDTISLTSATIGLSVPPTSGETVTADLVNGLVSYTPPPSFIGVQTIHYSITDGNGGVVSSTATITVGPVAAGPVTIADIYTVTTNANANDFDVLANDIDLANGGLTLTGATLDASIPGPSGSAVAVIGNQLRYTPATDFIGVDSVSYQITDVNGQNATGLVTFTVTPLAAPPAALPDVTTVQPDSTSNSINALANDVDLSSTGLTIQSVTSIVSVPAGANSTATTNGSTISYNPAAGFVGVETLSYTIEDGNGETATGIITVTVVGLPAALPPVAIADVANVGADSSNNSINVLSNDIDPAENGLTITSVNSLASAPLGANSTTSTDGNTVSYTPASGFIGVETLSYNIEDANGATATAAITIVVTGLPTALPPVAVPDVSVVNANSTDNSLTPLANDVDSSSTGLTITTAAVSNSLPAGNSGSVSTNGTTLTYTPANGFSGVETINYSITDGNGATASSAVTITVSPLPLPPVAVADIATVLAESSNNSIQALANDADVASAGLTITNVSTVTTLPAGSSGTTSTDGSSISYTPAPGFAGVETLSYEITDGNGNTATAVVTVTVTPLAAPPVATADLATVNQDSSDNTISPVNNDVDIAGGGLTLTNVSSLSTIPAGNAGSVNASGNNINYSPATGFAGVELLQYQIADNNGATATGLITVTIVPSPVTPSPLATPDVASVTQDSSNNVLDVLANDIDPASGGLTLTGVSVQADLPNVGGHAASLSGNQISFTPAAGYSGVVTLQYTLQDSNSTSANGLATITVTPAAAAAPPVPVADLATVNQNSSDNLISVLANDIDSAGGGLTLTGVSVASDVPTTGGHSASVNGTQVSFSPATGFVGLVTVTYTVEDNNGNSASGNAVITVNALPITLPPLAVPDTGSMTNAAASSFDVLSNDIDPASGGLTLSNVSITLETLPPLVGSNSVAVVANQLQVTPATGYSGIISISYEIEDTNGSTSSSTAVITVTP